GEGFEEIFRVDLEVFAGVAGVFDELHIFNIAAMDRQECLSYLIVLAAVGAGWSALFPARGLAAFFFGGETAFFGAADAAVGIQAFENEFRRGGADGVRLG